MLARFMRAAEPVMYQGGSPFAPISIRAMTTATSFGTTTTINLPAGTVNGDVLVMFISRNSTSATTATAPAGWSTIFNTSATNGASIFWKVASSEPASYTVTLGSTVNAGTVSLFTLANAAFTLSVTIRHSSATSSTPTMGTASTPTSDNSIVFSMVTLNNSGAVTMSNTYNAPMIEQTDLNAGGPHTSYQSVGSDIQTSRSAVTPSSTLNFALAWDMYMLAIAHA
jgi:hypothetical protein